MKSRFPCPHCHKLILSPQAPPEKGVFQCGICNNYFAIKRIDHETQEIDIDAIFLDPSTTA
jgi:transcription elongation factor Elf1